MHSPRHLTLCLGPLLAAAVLAPAASAAERHATPAGDGEACSSDIPCSISKAISGAASGDEVIVHPGEYALTTTIADPGEITVHGVAGQPRPRLVFSGDAQEGFRVGWHSTLRYVEVEQKSDSGNPAIFTSTSTVEQVVAKSSAPSSPTATIQKSEIRNSIVLAHGINGRAIQTSTSGGKNGSIYRNVTAIATASGGKAIRVFAAGAAGYSTVDLVNVIAQGAPAGPDVEIATDSSGANANISATHSYVGDVAKVGSNVVYHGASILDVAPVFVDAAAGDYRQAPASPTVDKGLDEPANGAFDVEGDPRTVGTTDIGADEHYVAPPPAAGDETPAPPSVVAPAPIPQNAFAGVTLASKRLAATRKAVALKVSCPAATVGPCSGRATLKARRARLGRATFTVASGSQATVKVTLTRAGRRLLRGTGRLRAKVRAEARDGAGAAVTTLTAVTIRRHR